MADAVVEEEKDHDTEQDRRDCLDEKHPLPAGEAVDALERVHDPAGKRVAEDAGDGDRRHEDRDDLGSAVRRIPIGEKEDDPGIEACFGDAEQEAQQIEHRRSGDEHEARRDQAPGDHDARDPDARADLMKNDVARHLEQEIAEEENACAETVGGFAEAEVRRHLELREADIDAVEIGDDVTQHQKRHEAPGDFAVGALFDVVFRPGLCRKRVGQCRHSFLP